MQLPLKLLGPPMPRQRAIGTMHSKPPASRIRAISTFFSQVGSKLVSASVIAQAFEQLEPKIPSLSLLSLNSGLPAARNGSRLPISFALHISISGSSGLQGPPCATGGQLPSFRFVWQTAVLALP